MDLASGTMVTANVRLVEPIAQGGMGAIWLADHLGLDAKVAVKFIATELVGKDPTLRERFKREASICARLRSVHVVQTFDHGVMGDGTPYIVMELLQGTTFTAMVETKGRLSPRQVGVIVSQVGKVLHRAHELGIVHRDIKPDNIFILDDDYELFVKVLDFGIAKSTQSHGEVVTKTGAIVGSPEFMSPEQAINSKDVDHRTDLYSLAVVAYYGLTGALPFEEDEDRPFWIQLASGDHIPCTRRVQNLPSALDDWFDKALRPKPNDRFQTARELADSLGQLVEQEGAGPVSTLSTSDDALHAKPPPPLDLAEQDTVRLRPPRPKVPPAMRAQLGSAPTLHAATPFPDAGPPSSSPSAFVASEPPTSRESPFSHRSGPPMAGRKGDDLSFPPWSQLQPPSRRPIWLVVALSLGAIIAVAAAVALLTRM